MPASGQIGSQGRMLMDAALPFDSSSVWLEFDSEDIVQDIPVLNSEGIRGTRSHASERNRRGGETVRGSIPCKMSRVLLDNILPAALGAVENGDVFDVSETIPAFFLLIDKGSDIVLLSNCKIGKLTVNAQESQFVMVTIEIEAESMTLGQSWPTGLAGPDVSSPFLFSDLGTVTVSAATRKPFDFEISVDNVLIVDKFASQLTRAGLLNASDRIVMHKLTVAGTTANADLMSHPTEGEQLTYVFTNSLGDEVTMTLGRVSFPAATPTTQGKGQRTFSLNGQSRALGHPGSEGHVPDISVSSVAGE